MKKLLLLIFMLLLLPMTYADITFNLTSYFTFDNNNITGTTLKDELGFQDGTLVGSPTTGEVGVINEAVLFDQGLPVAQGPEKYVTLGSSQMISDGNTASTVCAWINVTFPAQGHSSFTALFKQTTGSQLVVSAFNSSGTYLFSGGFRGTNNAFFITTTLADSENKWIFLCSVYQGGDKTNLSNHNMYLNGVLNDTGKAQNSPGGADTTNGININPGGFSTGRQLVDELGVWQRALNASEITQLYNDGAGLAYPFVVDLLIDQNTYNHTSARNAANQTIWRTSLTTKSQTFDSTPSVSFVINQVSNCSISTLNLNYTGMLADEISTQCATEDVLSHTCTLPSVKKINLSTTDIYISCQGDLANGVLSTSGALAIQLDTVELDYTTWNVSNAFANATIWRGAEITDNANITFPVRMRNGFPFVEVNTTVAANCSVSTFFGNYSAMIADDATTDCGDAMSIQHDCLVPASKTITTGDNKSLCVSCVGLEGESSSCTSGFLNLTRDRVIEGPVLLFNTTDGTNYTYGGANVKLFQQPSNNSLDTTVTNSSGIYQFFLTTAGTFTTCSHINNTVQDVCDNDIIVT